MATKLYIDLMQMNELEKFMERAIQPLVSETVVKVLDEYADEAVVNAKKEFGVYQPASQGQGESFPAWQQLAQRTIDQKKVRKGQNTPLLDSSDLQASVEKMAIDEYAKAVGTYDPNGARMEYGTAKAPARPWLRPALFALKAKFAMELRRRLIEVVKRTYKPMKSS